MCETTDLIKKLAHEGKSKIYVRKAIGGVGRKTFNDILDVIGDVKFYNGPTYTVRGFHGTIKEIIQHFGLSVRPRLITSRMHQGYNIEECFFVEKYGKVMTLNGFTGSITQVIKHFNLEISENAVRSRLHLGFTVEESFLDPVEVHQVRVTDPQLRINRQEELRSALSTPLFA